MSPRLKRLRKVLDVPIVKGFKPYGHDAAKINKEPINLLYEEYEALRLCDYNMENHTVASEIMEVSRPTFTRIYASARKKIASAFVEGRQIVIEGGKVYFDSSWHICNSCNSTFNNPNKIIAINNCALCGSSNISDYENEPLINDDKSCK